MKIFFIAISSLILPLSVNAENNQILDKVKLNGPECVSYLNQDLKIKFSQAYQICSNKTEERKICLVVNNKKSDKEKMNTCFKK